MNSKRCLVFAAHGDDETNGVGGTILKLRDSGWSVFIVYATLPTDPSLNHRRKNACLSVGKATGSCVDVWGLPDASLEVTEMTKKMTQTVFDQVKPDLVLVMNPIDVHPDHRAMASLAMGPALQKGVNTELMFYELCASGRHINADRPQTIGHYPTHFVDITDEIDRAAELQMLHDTEDPEAMIRGMRNVHSNRAKEYGLGAGGYMEAFMRITRVGPIQHGLGEIFLETPYVLPRPIGVDFDPGTIGL